MSYPALPYLSLPGFLSGGTPTIIDTDTFSAADVLRYWLISQSIVSDPGLFPLADWPCYVASEPDGDGIPDEVVTIYDTSGIIHQRSMETGERVYHDGIQIRVRADTHNNGYSKAKQIASAVDEDCIQQAVVIGTRQYRITAVTLTTNVVALGKEAPTSSRSLFTINGIMNYYEIMP